MGEIIKILGGIKFNGEDVNVELNKPHSKGQRNSVHLQTSKARFELSDKESVSFICAILSSIERLRELKKL